MSWIMVDVEADGPCPGLYSMTEIGMVVIKEGIEVNKMPHFYGKFKPLPGAFYVQEALNVCKRTREETEQWPEAYETMVELKAFLNQEGGTRPMFISDNNGFDFQFVNYYCWRFLGGNPFGHSSTNLGSLYKGMIKNTFKSFKHLRKTKHDHNPVNDAKGNVEALLSIINENNLKINLK